MHPNFLVLVLMAFTALPMSSWAAAGAWNSQPAWAAGNSNEPSGATKRNRSEAFANKTSPFAPGSNNVSLDVGQVFLMGDLSSTNPNAIGTRLHYTYGVSEVFGFDSSFGYSSHGTEYSMSSLTAGLRSNLSWYDKVIPHLVFGLGFYKPSYQLTATQSLSPVVFGMHLGPGIDLELTRSIFFGAALTFHDIFGTTTALPGGGLKEVDGTFTSFLLKAGVTF